MTPSPRSLVITGISGDAIGVDHSFPSFSNIDMVLMICTVIIAALMKLSTY
jgi:hypothetical protein